MGFKKEILLQKQKRETATGLGRKTRKQTVRTEVV